MQNLVNGYRWPLPRAGSGGDGLALFGRNNKTLPAMYAIGELNVCPKLAVRTENGLYVYHVVLLYKGT
ncbi:hypothetical protein HY311_03755 [Candidatus Nomurabacteria bacterium]|nr:hypothetical protein [Candidatus Nomurabacteria bacterium]